MTAGELKIYEEVIKISKSQSTFHSELLALKKTVENHDGHIETLKADRNKVIGVSWVGGLMITAGGLIYEFFKHKSTT